MYGLSFVAAHTALHIIIGLFVTTAILETIAQETHSFLIGGSRHEIRCYNSTEDPPWLKYIFIAILNFVFWPIILTYLLTVSKMSISIDRG